MFVLLVAGQRRQLENIDIFCAAAAAVVAGKVRVYFYYSAAVQQQLMGHQLSCQTITHAHFVKLQKYQLYGWPEPKIRPAHTHTQT